MWLRLGADEEQQQFNLHKLFYSCLVFTVLADDYPWNVFQSCPKYTFLLYSLYLLRPFCIPCGGSYCCLVCINQKGLSGRCDGCAKVKGIHLPWTTATLQTNWHKLSRSRYNPSERWHHPGKLLLRKWTHRCHQCYWFVIRYWTKLFRLRKWDGKRFYFSFNIVLKSNKTKVQC